MPVHLSELLTERNTTREENRLKLLRTIMAKSGSQVYLSNRSGLSQATVSTAVAELVEKKLLIRSTKDGKNVFVEMAPTTGAAVGIELGFQASAVVARRVEQPYNEAKTAIRRAVGATAGSAGWPRAIAAAVRDVVDELGEEEIAAIGLGVPRVVDPPSGNLVPPFLQPWKEGDDPARMLEEALRELKTPRLLAPKVVLDNDANLAALAESIYAFDEVEILIGIKASTGIGAGIVVGGKLFRGGCGVAGEIGHVVMQPGGRFCSCGGRGCLETLIGADALVEQAKMVVGRRRMDAPDSLDELVQMAGAGNLVCQRVLQEAATTLGFAIGNLCNVLNPQVVVLGGAFGRPGAVSHTLEYCQAALQRSAMRAACGTGLKVRASEVEHAAAHGALVVGLEGTSYPA